MTAYKKDFPILNTQVYGQPLVYLDNAATTQIPSIVLNRLQEHYCTEHANSYRGSYYLGQTSTKALEAARKNIHRFLDPTTDPSYETVFTGGTTDSINMIALGLRECIFPGDEIIVSTLEHHSNFVPWQQLCLANGAALRIVPVASLEAGDGFDMVKYEQLLNAKTKVVAITQASNLTGEILPIKEIAERAHHYGALVVVDGAQGVRQYDFPEVIRACDFYCFSAHKLFGPAGVGILFGKSKSMELLKPVRFGGGMVHTVKPDTTTFDHLPQRLEAGTLNSPAIIAFERALDYLKTADIMAIRAKENSLMNDLLQSIRTIPDLQIVGDQKNRRFTSNKGFADILSFEISGIDSFDIASYLDHLGIALRQGNHCAQPAMAAYGFTSALRVSPAFYNSHEDIARFITGIQQAINYYRRWK